MQLRLLATVVVLTGMLWSPAGPSGLPSPSQEAPVFSARSELVVLQVRVEDRDHHSVTDLPGDAFTVLEDGTPQQIAFFTPQDAPVTVGLLIDNSGSMLGIWNLVAAAAGEFVATSNPEDQVFALTFTDRVLPVLQSGELFTSDAAALRSSLLDAVAPRGRTAMYDAIVQGLHYLSRGTHDRKLLVIVTDDRDNASIATLDQVLRQVQASNVLLYAIVVRDPVRGRADVRHLDRLAKASGGELFEPADAAGVHAALQHIANDVRRMYTIGYTPEQAKGPGLRRIRVRVHAPGLSGLHVRTRLGYVVDDDH